MSPHVSFSDQHFPRSVVGVGNIAHFISFRISGDILTKQVIYIQFEMLQLNNLDKISSNHVLPINQGAQEIRKLYKKKLLKKFIPTNFSA